MISRRSLLSVAPTLALVPLAACSTTNGTTTINNNLVSTVLTDVQAIATGFRSALTALSGVKNLNVPADTLNTAQNALASIQGVVSSLAGVTTVTAAQPLVQQVETYVNTFVGALAAVPFLPPPVQGYLLAATILLPIIESAVNLVLPPVEVPPTITAPAPATPDAARAKLTS